MSASPMRPAPRTAIRRLSIVIASSLCRLMARRRAIRARSADAPGTSPRAQPRSRISPANPATPRTGRGARRSCPSTQRPVSEEWSLTSERSPTMPWSKRPRPSSAITPTDHGPTARSRPRRAATVLVGCRRSDSKSMVAASRWSAVARCWASPSRRSSTGESRRSASCVTTSSSQARDRPLEYARGVLDELSHQSAHDGVRDRRDPTRPVADERARRRPDEGVVGEPPVKAGRVVVEREHEPRGRECLLVRGAHDDATVGALARDRDAAAWRAPRQVPPGAMCASRHGPTGVTRSSTTRWSIGDWRDVCGRPRPLGAPGCAAVVLGAT